MAIAAAPLSATLLALALALPLAHGGDFQVACGEGTSAADCKRVRTVVSRPHGLPELPPSLLRHIVLESGRARFDLYGSTSTLYAPASATRDQLWNAVTFIGLSSAVTERFGLRAISCLDYDKAPGQEAYYECNRVLSTLLPLSPTVLADHDREAADIRFEMGPGPSFFMVHGEDYLAVANRSAGQTPLWNLLRSASLAKNAQKHTRVNAINCDSSVASRDDYYSCQLGLGKLSAITGLPRLPGVRSIEIGAFTEDFRRAGGNVVLDYRMSVDDMANYLKDLRPLRRAGRRRARR